MRLDEATVGTEVEWPHSGRRGVIVDVCGIEHREVEWENGDRSVLQSSRLALAESREEGE